MMDSDDSAIMLSRGKENWKVSHQKRKEKIMQAAKKSSSHQLRKRGHLGRKAASPEKKRGVSHARFMQCHGQIYSAL